MCDCRICDCDAPWSADDGLCDRCADDPGCEGVLEELLALDELAARRYRDGVADA